MAWKQPVETWFPCVRGAEQEAIVLICDQIILSNWQLPELAYTATVLVAGLGYDTDRELTFRAIYGIKRVSTPFPPPLDTVFTFPAAYWEEMRHFIDNAPPWDYCDCPPIAFVGNRGGAWPECP